uniref:AB hydrolase-1 domain-containing protein n=1 Tax=Arcella intermedia TaxID=1963864 RepID=A0A6B2LB86_9EUKA|eukprot:TRINITY_DN6200_c0_g1_i1.p1 TRINITY_DN6200_c0_g1~~TRINITY_DN6200_c0_g1_i1.p1  ORF type:complete len:318 (-),score=81.77 TRINITY_DN6200_c0_g1_i1:27-959(-)
MHCVVAGGRNEVALVLCHGFPELWCSWKKLIQPLALKYKVIVPTLRGFGQSSAPEDVNAYSFQELTTDLAQLLDHFNIKKAIFIGHDHGGALVWRMCLYYPERVLAVASFCTPYTPPKDTYVSIQDIVKVLPQFAYQLYFQTDQARIEFESNLELFFKTFLRGAKVKTPVNPPPFVYSAGPILPTVPKDLDIHPMLTQQEFNYYVQQYKHSGLKGALNWYRTHKINFEIEKTKKFNVVIPHKALMVTAGRDVVLPPSMANNMPNLIPNLTMVNIEEANHWILLDYPERCTEVLLNWLATVDTQKSNKANL